MTVLGSGSNILGLTTAQLGARHVTCIDHGLRGKCRLTCCHADVMQGGLVIVLGSGSNILGLTTAQLSARHVTCIDH